MNKAPGYSFVGSDNYTSSEEENVAPKAQLTSRKHKTADKTNESCRRQHVTAGESISALSTSNHKMAGTVANVISKQSKTSIDTPQAQVIARIAAAKESTQEKVVQAIKCVMRDSDLANAYLALNNLELGAEIHCDEIDVAVILHTTTKQDEGGVNCQDISQSVQGGDKSH